MGNDYGTVVTELRFYLLQGMSPSSGYYLRHPDRPEERTNLSLGRGRKSPPHPYRGSSELLIWMDEWDAESGNHLPRVVSRTLLPETDRALVLLSEDPINRGQLMMRAFDDSLQRLPADHLVFLNLSPFHCVGVVSNVNVSVGPGMSTPVDLRSWVGQSDVLIGLLSVEPNGIQLVMENRIRVVPGWRTILLLLPGKEGANSVQDLQLIRILEAVLEREE